MVERPLRKAADVDRRCPAVRDFFHRRRSAAASLPVHSGALCRRHCRGRGIAAGAVVHRRGLPTAHPRPFGLAEPDGDRDRHPAGLFCELGALLSGTIELALDVRRGHAAIAGIFRGAVFRSGEPALAGRKGRAQSRAGGAGAVERKRWGGGGDGANRGGERPGGRIAPGAVAAWIPQSAGDRPRAGDPATGYRHQYGAVLRFGDLQGTTRKPQRLGGHRGPMS